jgi:hypothetical protein
LSPIIHRNLARHSHAETRKRRRSLPSLDCSSCYTSPQTLMTMLRQTHPKYQRLGRARRLLSLTWKGNSY